MRNYQTKSGKDRRTWLNEWRQKGNLATWTTQSIKISCPVRLLALKKLLKKELLVWLESRASERQNLQRLITLNSLNNIACINHSLVDIFGFEINHLWNHCVTQHRTSPRQNISAKIWSWTWNAFSFGNSINITYQILIAFVQREKVDKSWCEIFKIVITEQIRLAMEDFIQIWQRTSLLHQVSCIFAENDQISRLLQISCTSNEVFIQVFYFATRMFSQNQNAAEPALSSL